MNLNQRINLLVKLGKYISADSDEWQQIKRKAEMENNWFTANFINQAAMSTASQYLNENILNRFAEAYSIEDENKSSKTVGIVMAGNIPLVGFHDFLCVFLSGHHIMIKPSSKDEVLIKHLVKKLTEWNATTAHMISFSSVLKGCDAYIATGSNNSGRYFDYYFRKYPHIIRRNRTSVAILTGKEFPEELELLADDVHLYFGLGCRNVTKLYTPPNYDFIPLLEAFRKYSYFIDHHKYKNNFDYYLAIQLLNNKYYMTNGSILLTENPSLFSPISQLNYEFYSDKQETENHLLNNKDVQCIIGHGHLSFGRAQFPSITDFADGVNTMEFLGTL